MVGLNLEHAQQDGAHALLGLVEGDHVLRTQVPQVGRLLGQGHGALEEVEHEEAIGVLKARYSKEDSGLCLLKLEDKYQLCSKTEFADSIRKVIEVKKNAPLSQAALEVLAIVAYNQNALIHNYHKYQNVGILVLHDMDFD